MYRPTPNLLFVPAMALVVFSCQPASDEPAAAITPTVLDVVLDASGGVSLDEEAHLQALERGGAVRLRLLRNGETILVVDGSTMDEALEKVYTSAITELGNFMATYAKEATPAELEALGSEWRSALEAFPDPDEIAAMSAEDRQALIDQLRAEKRK